jgi:hypothetical protein
MKRRVLVVYYSQTGQLKEIVSSVLGAIEGSPEVEIVYEELKPVTSYPFPWTALEFCDAFPESVKEVPCELQPLSCDPNDDFDLVILAYTVWYLAPSIPVMTFLRSPQAEAIVGNRPVITIIGCRNMWLLAQERVKEILHRIGGRLTGNIVLTDRASNLIGILTIAVWMLTGKKKRFLGIFPRPGISDRDIRGASRFGESIRTALEQDEIMLDQEALNAMGAVTVRPSLMLMEKRVSKVFKIWAAFIRRKGGPGKAERRLRVRLFMIYLIAAVIVLAPLASLAGLILGVIRKDRIDAEIEHYYHNAIRGNPERDSG